MFLKFVKAYFNIIWRPLSLSELIHFGSENEILIYTPTKIIKKVPNICLII